MGLGGCACAIIFFLLLSLDAWRAIKRKAYWFPARFLALNALTLLFIYYVDYSTVNVTSGTKHIARKDVKKFLKNQLVIDSGRLVICVFIAYLVPGLVSSGFRSVWGYIGLLALNVLFHMFYEIYFIHYIYAHSHAHLSHYEETWFTVFSVMVFIVIILLVLLSICVVFAGKSIRILIKKKVCSELSCCSNSRTDCGNIMDHVLKCWIVVRSSQPEYIMARSVVSSFAGLLVTVCFILMAVKWICIYKHDYKPLNRTTLCLQFIFALFGWIVVSVRWLTAVRYFPRVGQKWFQVDDFWKRSLLVLRYGRLKGPLFRERRNRNYTLLERLAVDLIFAVHLDSFVLFIGFLLQILIVFLSKALFFLSRILFWPLLMDPEKIWRLSRSEISTSNFSKYRIVLESIAMPGEMAESLWIANESAFKSTQEHMLRGSYSGQVLIEMIRQLKAEAPVTDEGEEEMYLDYAGERSWKLKAVSLIHFILRSYDGTEPGVVDYAFKACSEAWPLMDLVETSDTEANLPSLAADKEFDDLQNIWKKYPKNKSTQYNRLRTIQKRKIKDTIQKRIIDDIRSRILQEPMEDMTAAVNFSLSKTAEAIDLYSAQAINKLRCLLADVIIDCLKNEVKNALREKCNEWAVLGGETEIYHAAFIAGKAIRVLDWYDQTSQGNDEVPPEVPEGHVNNASGRAALYITL